MADPNEIDAMVKALGGDPKKADAIGAMSPGGGQTGMQNMSDEQLQKLSQSMPLPPGTPSDENWYKWAGGKLLDVGTGIAQGAANFADAPYRLITGKPPVPSLQPSTDPQRLGRGIWNFGSTMATVPTEAKGAEMLSEATKGLPAAYRYIMQILGNTAIGASGAASTAFANAQDPVLAAKVGALFPGLFSLIPPSARGSIKESARTSMARAIEPSGKISKGETAKVVDRLLDTGTIVTSAKGLEKRAQRGIDEAAQMQAQAEASMGTNPALPATAVEDTLRQAAEDKFLKGTAGGQLDPNRNLVGPTVKMANTQEEMDLYNEFLTWMQKYLDPQKVSDPVHGQAYLFSRLKDIKASLQKQPGNKGAFLEIPGLNLSPRTEVYETAANALRPQMEAAAPPEWKEANELFHEWLLTRKLARQRQNLDVGTRVPVYERPITGFGAKFGVSPMKDPSLPIRILRMVTDSPFFNSSVAQGKNFLAETPGFGPGQAAAWLTGQTPEGPPVDTSHINESPKQGQKVTLPDPLGIR